MKPYYQDNSIQLYHGDCREIVPNLDLYNVDLILTDPPYGISYSAKKQNYPNAQIFNDMDGDDNNVKLIKWLLSFDKTIVIWGANNFPQLLPFGGVWLCWDKRVTESADKMFGWPFELAWVNKDHGKARIYRIQHGGVVNADGYGIKRLHPTQKPVMLFKRVIQDFSSGKTILDPFVGSGTTLIAAKELNRSAIGIEIEERYCEIIVERLRQCVMPLE